MSITSGRDGSEPWLRKDDATVEALHRIAADLSRFTSPQEDAPAGPPLHEQADRDGDNVPSDRVRAYAEAIDNAVLPARLRAVMAVADREQAALRAEVERLRRWKAEVTLGLQDLGKALGLHLGERITGPSATEAAKRLSARAENVERPYLCRHGKTAEEHWCDDHGDRAKSGPAPTEEARTLGGCMWCDKEACSHGARLTIEPTEETS